MVVSKLAGSIVEASNTNYTPGRNGYNICKITPHQMAGVLSAEQCGYIFQNPLRRASSNYGIGNDGDIACYVGEENRAWTSANRNNDYQAITIEVSNSEVGGDYPISDAAWNSLVNLCVDICQRYNFRLNYDGTPNGSLTRHNMFANTNCPGPYLQARFSELAETVNRILDGQPTPEPTPEPQPAPTPQPSTGDDKIKVIQSWLNNGYGTGIAEDGYYGPQTKKALVKALQTELNRQYGAGLLVDRNFRFKDKIKVPECKDGSKR